MPPTTSFSSVSSTCRSFFSRSSGVGFRFVGGFVRFIGTSFSRHAYHSALPVRVVSSQDRCHACCASCQLVALPSCALLLRRSCKLHVLCILVVQRRDAATGM